MSVVSKMNDIVSMENRSIISQIQAGTPGGSLNVFLLIDFLRVYSDIDFIRHEWLDYFDIMRVKMILRKRVLRIVMSQRPIIRCHSIAMKFLVDGSYSSIVLIGPDMSLCFD